MSNKQQMQTSIAELKQISKKNPLVLIAVGFGSGLNKTCPGTTGTLAALPMVYLCSIFSNHIYATLMLLLCAAGVFICNQAAKAIKDHDHPAIVIDEFAGIMIACFGVIEDAKWVIVAFILFRFFDIVKPFPIKYIDSKVKNGLGVMLDDIIAGLITNIIIRIIQSLL